ncbi:putative F-box protein At1g32420 [Papaver somniferum]|uniref:putative F-box protein At1g32420 n=1 Tax=Papaver somniferum TaxID=3469 RepID=UPI000E703F46|nr:putative F-box protein At1g32420 [Papaver somniferum]
MQIQILSRLPVESLMRFKCVCTRWKSLISEDPWLVELHNNHSKKQPCLVVVPKQIKARIDECTQRSYKLKSYLTASLSVERKTRQTTTMHTLSKRESNFMVFDYVIGPVNGLFGFAENYISTVTIYNFSTQEVVQQCSMPTLLTKSKQYPCYVAVPDSQHYFFGFDSTINKYKVVCVWRVQDCQACEVFTLNSSITWKKIDQVIPPCCFHEKYVFANNSIYWRSSVKDLRSLRFFVEQLSKIDTSNDEVLVAFDLGSEKFRVIHVPNFVPPRNSHLDLSCPDGRTFKFHPVLLEVDGRVVISNRLDYDIIELYVMDDECVNKVNANMMNWSKESIEVPIVLNYAWIVVYSLPGSDYILLVCYNCHAKIRSPSLYFYNRKKKTFKMIIFDEWGSNFHHPYMYSTFVESLSPFRF